ELAAHHGVIMIAADADLAAALDQVDDLRGARTIADDVSGAHDGADLAILEMRDHRAQCLQIGMHVGNDGDMQLDPPVPHANCTSLFERYRSVLPLAPCFICEQSGAFWEQGRGSEAPPRESPPAGSPGSPGHSAARSGRTPRSSPARSARSA